MKFKHTVLIMTVVAMMGLLLGASAAQAFTVVVDEEIRSKATAILNLEVNGVHYDVTFPFGSINDIWGDEAFDFDQLGAAVAAMEAVNDALNTDPLIRIVGDENGDHSQYKIPYKPNGIFSTIVFSYFANDINEWTLRDSTGNRSPLYEAVYAKFTNRQEVRGPAPVPKTGQTVTVLPGDDGDLQRGQSWPDPRLTDNGDGTVTDNLTGLIWLRDANCFNASTWAEALQECNDLRSGDCGLVDGSSPGDWRLPNIKELLSLIDYSNAEPALPTAHLFTGVMSGRYWSSTSVPTDVVEGAAWTLDIWYGLTFPIFTDSVADVWPVRGGND